MKTGDLELFARCLPGLEKPLADELKALGAARVRPLSGGVAFFSNIYGILKICLWSRLASRVMLVVGRVDAGNAALLYEGVRRLPWEKIIAFGASVSVQAHGVNDELRNTRFTALKVKDALCDHLREVWGLRPNVDTISPEAAIDVRVREKHATVSLDLSGESFYRRGYLSHDDGPDDALECAQAAGLLALAGWDGETCGEKACLDPVCGNGALIIEAASVACDLAPNIIREHWGFKGWAQMDEDIWADLLNEADERFERGIACVMPPKDDLSPSEDMDISASAGFDAACTRFVGISTSSPSIAQARLRVKRAGLCHVISIEFADEQTLSALVKRMSGAVRCAALNSGMTGVSDIGHIPKFLVAGILSTREHVQGEARIQAETAAFVRACLEVPAGSEYAVCGGRDSGERFGIDPIKRVVFGGGRITCTAWVFDMPPSGSAWLMVPDSAGGAEHRVEVFENTTDQFVARLRKTAKERRKWAKREGVSCYRIYDADLSDYVVAIDVYTGAGQAEGNTYVHVAEYAPPDSVDFRKSRRRFSDVLSVVPVVLGVRPDHIFDKTRRRDRGGSQYRETKSYSYVTYVQENGYIFEVELSQYLDTGLFLDHRLTRELIGRKAAGKRFLNLFAYTGTASVYAAGGNAESTCTVDLSQTYLDWARRNMEQNGFKGERHMFERADVMTWITQCRRTSRRFDLIFVDPPTFSNSKAMGKRTWDVQRDHVELLIGVSRLLTKGGQAIFSCNLRSFKPNETALAKYGVELKDITTQTIPHDFKRNPRIHKCYVVQRSGNLGA